MPQASVNGIRIHYELSGRQDGPVVLFSNSLASTLNMWDWQMPAFEPRYRVVRYDSRGHGRSDAPQGPYSIEMLVDDAVGLLDHLGIEKAHVVGLSKGGMVGLRMATLHPDRVDRLAACDTSAYVGAPDVWETRIRTVEEQGLAAIAPATIDRWFTKPFQERDPAAIDRIRAMIVNTPVAGFVGCARAIMAMDQRQTIETVAAPTLVVVGAEDSGTTPDMAREIHRRVAGSRLEILADAAHLSNIEQQAAFDAAVLGFLDGG